MSVSGDKLTLQQKHILEWRSGEEALPLEFVMNIKEMAPSLASMGL